MCFVIVRAASLLLAFLVVAWQSSSLPSLFIACFTVYASHICLFTSAWRVASEFQLCIVHGAVLCREQASTTTCNDMLHQHVR